MQRLGSSHFQIGHTAHQAELGVKQGKRAVTVNERSSHRVGAPTRRRLAVAPGHHQSSVETTALPLKKSSAARARTRALHRQQPSPRAIDLASAIA
jgi:hypothetical protein